MDNETKTSFVFYTSFLDAIEEFDTEEEKQKMALAIVRLGITGEWDSTLPSYIRVPLKQMEASIMSAKDRYLTAIENGKKGGRPSKVDKAKLATMIAAGLSNKEIAEAFEVTEGYIATLRKKN